MNHVLIMNGTQNYLKLRFVSIEDAYMFVSKRTVAKVMNVEMLREIWPSSQELM